MCQDDFRRATQLRGVPTPNVRVLAGTMRVSPTLLVACFADCRLPPLDPDPIATCRMLAKTQNMNDIARYEVLEPRASGKGVSIGEGAYGVVYKALDRVTNKLVALKKMRVQSEGDIGISSSTLREITLLMQLDHENVVKLENVVMVSDCSQYSVNIIGHFCDLAWSYP